MAIRFNRLWAMMMMMMIMMIIEMCGRGFSSPPPGQAEIAVKKDDGQERTRTSAPMVGRGEYRR
jgi:hypothetical protein